VRIATDDVIPRPISLVGSLCADRLPRMTKCVAFNLVSYLAASAVWDSKRPLSPLWGLELTVINLTHGSALHPHYISIRQDLVGLCDPRAMSEASFNGLQTLIRHAWAGADLTYNVQAHFPVDSTD